MVHLQPTFYVVQKTGEMFQWYPISTFACMGDEGWLESGEMGWFGISDNNKDDLSWNQMVEQFVAALPEDAMLLSVDCHI